MASQRTPPQMGWGGGAVARLGGALNAASCLDPDVPSGLVG